VLFIIEHLTIGRPVRDPERDATAAFE